MNDDPPVAERTVSDVETLKALSDPLRLRILEAMVQAPDESWSVKRLAAALGVGPTKLYHHVSILEERELVRVAGTRVVSGIIETSYRIAQLSVRLDRSLLSGGGADASSSPVEGVVASVVDAAREGIGRALRAGAMTIDADGADPGMVRQELKRLTPERAVELKRRMTDLLAEYDDGPTAVEDASAAAVADDRSGAYGLLVAFYPIVPADRTATDD